MPKKQIVEYGIMPYNVKPVIYSPDTDVYNIGLPFSSQLVSTTMIIQLNVPHTNEKKYLNINMMRTALQKDSDLGNLCQEKLCRIFQTLFICTGCDYVSYVFQIHV